MKNFDKKARAYALKSEIVIRKAYKVRDIFNNSSLRIVSMIPGDREVAGCFNFYS